MAKKQAINTDAVERLKVWREHPDIFVQDLFKCHIEEWQREALKSIATHDKVSIRSGHGVGKSALLSWVILWFISTRSDARVPCTAPSSHQLSDVLWAELLKWLRKAPDWYQSQFEMSADRVRMGSSYAVARTSRKEQPEALQGFHAENLLFVIDEASGVPNSIFDVSSSSLSTEGAKIIMTGNPTRVAGYFYDSHHKMRNRWETMVVSCKDSTQVSETYIEDMLARCGNDTDADLYRVRVLGEFPKSESNGVIPLDLVIAAYDRPVEQIKTVMPVWGLDVARFGTNKTALVKRHANIVKSVETITNRDTMYVAGWVMQQYEDANSDDRPAVINIDSIGVGAGVVDRMRELDVPVQGINVGEQPSGKDRYANLRAELWWRAREWLEQRDTRVESEDLGAELTEVQFKITSTGKIQIESKDDMLKRGVTSPDIADAFVLTFAGAERRRGLGRYAVKERKQSAGWAA